MLEFQESQGSKCSSNLRCSITTESHKAWICKGGYVTLIHRGPITRGHVTASAVSGSRGALLALATTLPTSLSMFRLISQLSDRFSVAWLCRQLGVARSGFYAWR
jgi:hypothetical protein